MKEDVKRWERLAKLRAPGDGGQGLHAADNVDGANESEFIEGELPECNGPPVP